MNGFNSKRFNSDTQMQYPNEQLFARRQAIMDSKCEHLNKN